MAQRPFDITHPVGTDRSVEQADEGHEVTDRLSDMAARQMQSDIEILAELDEDADGDDCEYDDLWCDI